ncbi:MAG: hypothetical protein R3F30_09745 [Planctomycetota bacterium]
MTLLRAALAIALVLLGLYFIAANWACVLVSLRNRRRGIPRHHPVMPLLSVFASIGALVLYPWSPATWILLIPAVDIGNWVLVIGLPWSIAAGSFRTTGEERSATPPGDPEDRDYQRRGLDRSDRVEAGDREALGDRLLGEAEEVFHDIPGKSTAGNSWDDLGMD